MDISPSQMVSISAALIPSWNTTTPTAPSWVPTCSARPCRCCAARSPWWAPAWKSTWPATPAPAFVAQADGKVEYADADRIVVSYEGDLYKKQGGVRAYDLLKFHKSNQNSLLRPEAHLLPRPGVQEGRDLADGPGIDEGQLALGKNLVVAFMPWCGYNYEDSILISERTVKEDIFTSIHIEEFEVVARDTKLGPEEITRDIPNVSEDMLRNLDDSGIIRIGAAVKPDDILVGKITPRGETQLTPEEKAVARHLRREGPRREEHLPQGAPREWKARSSTSRCSTAAPVRRTTAPWPSRPTTPPCWTRRKPTTCAPWATAPARCWPPMCWAS